MERITTMMKRMLLITAALIFAAAVLPENGGEEWLDKCGFRQEAYAADAKEVYVAGNSRDYNDIKGYYDRNYTRLEDGGKIYDKDNTEGAGTAEFKDGVLTLDGYKFNGYGMYERHVYSYCIYAEGDLEIRVKGNCELINDSLFAKEELPYYPQPIPKSLYGIYVDGKLTITNVYSEKGSLKIETKRLPDYSSCGICCKGLTIYNNGPDADDTISVTSTAGTADHIYNSQDHSYGTWIMRGGEGVGLNMQSGTFYSKGGGFQHHPETNCKSYGLYSEKGITIAGGRVDVEGNGRSAESGGLYLNYDWDSSYQLDITGGELEAGSSGGRYGIEFDRYDKDSINLTKGKITASGKTCAIYNAKSVKAPIMKGSVKSASGFNLQESNVYNDDWKCAVLDGNRLKVNMKSWTYGDDPGEPSWTPKNKDDFVTTIYRGRDATVYSSYDPPTAAGDYTVNVSYRDSKQAGSADYSIAKRDFSDPAVEFILDPESQKKYTGREQEAVYTFTINGKPMVKDTDFIVTGDTAKDVENKTITFTGTGSCTGTISRGWQLKKADCNDLFCPLNGTKEVFATGKPIKVDDPKPWYYYSHCTGYGKITMYYKRITEPTTTEPPTTDPPSAIGEYDLTYDVTEGSNYNAATGIENGKLKIKKGYYYPGVGKNFTVQVTAKVGQKTFVDLSPYMAKDDRIKEVGVSNQEGIDHFLDDSGQVHKETDKIISFTLESAPSTSSEGAVALAKTTGTEYFDFNNIRVAVKAADCSAPELEHTEKKDAGCETDGNIEYWTCSECGKHFLSGTDESHPVPNYGGKEELTIPAKGHDYELKESVPPTCTVPGKDTYVCKNDPSHVRYDEYPALGHVFTGEWKVTAEPTCVTDGKMSNTCSRCGEVIAAIPATGVHTYGDWVVTKKPTGKEKGVRTRTCLKCGNKETGEIPATGEIEEEEILEDEFEEGSEKDPKEGEAQKKLIDRVPLIGDEKYPSSKDNFAPLTKSGKIKKLEVDFQNVSKSDVKPTDLRMTVIKGSKLTTVAKVKDKQSVKGTDGVKVKFQKKTGKALITCKKDGTAELTMDDGKTYKITFTVDTPKAQKKEKKQKKDTITLSKTIKELFNTDIDSGELKITKEKVKDQARVSDNNIFVLTPAQPDKISLQYRYLNKKYKIAIKVK